MCQAGHGCAPFLAQALGIQQEKGGSLVEQVKEILRELSILLVLDNFEQVLAARMKLADLLASCPKLKVLVTSREMLHLQAEQLFEVSPLPLPASEHLSISKRCHRILRSRSFCSGPRQLYQIFN